MEPNWRERCVSIQRGDFCRELVSEKLHIISNGKALCGFGAEESSSSSITVSWGTPFHVSDECRLCAMKSAAL